MSLNKYFDYTDNFSEVVRTIRPISAEELAARFLCTPQWIIALMKVRNAIIKPFGLNGERNLSDLVIVESDSLATISKSDRHLDFVIAFMTERRMNDSVYLSVCTKVRYNNCMGKFYFSIIKPFHKLICKILLKQVRRNL